MPRDIPVGNGTLLVTFDGFYQIRDIYFPHVGSENHTAGHASRFGVWADNDFAWMTDDGWRRELRYLPETLVTEVRLTHTRLRLELTCYDAVDFHENIYLRRIIVRDLSARETGAGRDVRLFLHHDFYMSETNVGDTVFYDPELGSLIHHKGQRYFLISTDAPHGVETFATGRKAFQGAEGTWRDAEDGTLSNSPIMEGSVDSTIGYRIKIEPGGTGEMHYWIAAGKSFREVADLHRLTRTRTPASLLRRTENYWRAWVNKNDTDFATLPAHVVESFKRSLLIARTQIDEGGAITAANDSDVTVRATDHYSYVWTRDGALVAYALDLAGYPSLTRAFFRFCARVIEPEGYFLQKYNPDGSPASSWHARWDAATGKPVAPIQADETALVLWALWHHYDLSRDIEFIRALYRPLITRGADFLVEYRNPHTGLPLPSWNLWEDRRGIHTFTVASTVGALRAAANFAELFGDHEDASRYLVAADTMREGLRTHLYHADHKRFARAIVPAGDNSFDFDMTIDASVFGIFYFGVFDPYDEVVTNTMRAVEERLTIKTEVGGVARFEHDGYMSVTRDTANVPGNPWFICTLWLADYYIALAQTETELERALPLIEWAVNRALPSGAFAEQIHPHTGAPLSVAPLTWSHATFVATVMSYLKKMSDVRS